MPADLNHPAGPATVPDSASDVRIRLDISYDGTDFAGWAPQPGRRTVAGELCRALELLCRAPVRLVVAGRTDAGVHASAQVAHVDVAPESLAALTPRHLRRTSASVGGPVGLLRRLAGLLPTDVRVRRVTHAPPGFDARFSALRRHYEYRIGTAPWGVEPAARRFVLAHRRDLDDQAMAAAAATLPGLHDFAAFCRSRSGATTIRELQRLTVERAADQLRIRVSADAFCHSMVRALVGALIAVGEGRLPVDRPAALLAAGHRTAEIHVAPAHGLTLIGVDYPPDSQLGHRAATTRAVRAPQDQGPADQGPSDQGPADQGWAF